MYPDTNRFRISTPLVWEKKQSADGASCRRSPYITDSLCKKFDTHFTFLLHEIDDLGARVIWIAESTDADDMNTLSGAGWLDFDASGTFVDASTAELKIVRSNGARNPTTFPLEYGKHFLGLTASAEVRDGFQVYPSRRFSSPDLNNDGWVDSADLILLIRQWDMPRRIRPNPAFDFPEIIVDE